MKKILQLTEYICYDLLPLIGMLCLIGLGCFLPLVSRAAGTVEQEIFIPEALETLTSDIVGTVEYVNEKGVTEVIYAYDSKVEVTNEIPLTYNTVDLGNGQLKMYVGAPFLKTGDTWTYVETATTTKQNFDYLAAPEEKILMRFKNFFLPYAAAQDTIYSGGGDGSVRNSGSVWSTVHDAASGDIVYNTNSWVQATLSGGNYYIGRAFYPIDTSSLPDNVTVTDAEFNFTVDAVDAGTTQTACLVGTDPADPENLAVGDYDTVGTDKLSDDEINIASTGGKSMTLNAAGLAFIDLQNITMLGLREKKDLENTTQTVAAQSTIFTSEASGTENDPYLLVTYTEEEPPAGTSTIAVASSSLDYPGNFSSVLFIPIVVWFFLILWLFLLYALWPYA